MPGCFRNQPSKASRFRRNKNKKGLPVGSPFRRSRFIFDEMGSAFIGTPRLGARSKPRAPKSAISHLVRRFHVLVFLSGQDGNFDPVCSPVSYTVTPRLKKLTG